MISKVEDPLIYPSLFFSLSGAPRVSGRLPKALPSYQARINQKQRVRGSPAETRARGGGEGRGAGGERDAAASRAGRGGARGAGEWRRSRTAAAARVICSRRRFWARHRSRRGVGDAREPPWQSQEVPSHWRWLGTRTPPDYGSCAQRGIASVTSSCVRLGRLRRVWGLRFFSAGAFS